MSAYDGIFFAYTEELAAARAEVMQWWNGLMAAASPTGQRCP